MTKQLKLIPKADGAGVLVPADVLAELGLAASFHKSFDLHVHVPEGAIPKDGPSAGIAITTSIVSAMLRIPVKRTVAMTGEVTLRGRVLAIGGLKEKTMAAKLASIGHLDVAGDACDDVRGCVDE